MNTDYHLLMNYQYFSATVVTVVLLLLLYYLLSTTDTSNSKNRKLKAPEAAGSRPLIGHLHLLVGRNQLLHNVLGAMADKYGPVFTIRMGFRRALVVSSWEVVKDCFTTNDRALSSRPCTAGLKHMSYNYAMVGFGPYGPYWRELRKILNQEILSTTRIELLKHVWDSEIKTSIKELYEVHWGDKNKVKGSPVLVDLKSWLWSLTLNITVKMVVGKRYFSCSSSTSCEDRKQAERLKKGMRDFLRLIGQFVVSDSSPFLEWLDIGGYIKEMKSTAKELDSLLQGWLEEHKRNRLAKKAVDHVDFMDVMLSKLEDAELYGFDPDTVNKATCLTLIFGGLDPTMGTLVWALSLLLNNQHVLKNAYDELDIHVGRERQVEESDIKNLVYLQAIIKETLRLYPPGPISALREAMEDCTVAGYYVPAGTRLIVITSKLQRDPQVWANPLEFQPERFFTNHIDVDVRGKNFELIPFGSGRRSCPGASLSLQVMHLTLARLIHGFQCEKPLDAPIDMTESAGLTNIKATPLEVFLTPRLPQLYV